MESQVAGSRGNYAVMPQTGGMVTEIDVRKIGFRAAQ